MRPSMPRMLSFAIAACAIATALPVQSTEYHWTPTGPPFWTSGGNWTPNRIIALGTDRLVFDGGGTTTATGVTSQGISQLVVTNGTKLTLQAGAAGNQLLIQGDTGPDLEITAGSELTLSGANALLINLAAGTTGSIAGGVTMSGAADRLQALDTDAVTFAAGSFAVASTGFIGNMFGTGSGASGLNSVRFQAGSAYTQAAGDHPFGAAQPATVLTFDPGSLFRLDSSAIAPQFSGRTYGNFEYNGSAGVATSGSAPCTIDSIVINSGVLDCQLTGTLSLRGSIRTNGLGVLQLGPSSGSANYRLNGTVTQLLVDSSTPVSGRGINFRPSLKLTIDNPAGMAMSSLHTIPGILEFVRGTVTMSLDLGATGSILGASASTGWLVGSLRSKLPPGNPITRLEVGTPTAYQPIDLRLHGVPDSIRIAGWAIPSQGVEGWPYQGTQLDSLTLVQSLFLFATFGTETFTSFDAVFHYDSPDYPAGADPANFVARMNPFNFPAGTDPNTGWRSTTTGVRTPTSLEVLGATKSLATDNNFYFLVGDPTVVRISVFDTSKVEETVPMVPLRFRVVLSEPALDPVAVNFTTVSGSALAGSDFGTTLGTISFAPGNTLFYVPVPIVADATPEADETFSLVLSNPFRAVLDRGTATGTILDNDDVTPPTVTVLSPNGGETVVQGASVNLDWTASDNVGVDAVDLYLSRDDGATWESIATDLANTGSYAWTSTGPLTQLARLKVVARDYHVQTGEDASDAAWAISDATGVEPVIPVVFAFDLASANPSRGTSRIRYALPRDQHVRLAIMDVRGRVVAVLKNDDEVAGTHEVAWEGRTGGGTAPAGIYFVSFQSEEWSAQRRIVRLR